MAILLALNVDTHSIYFISKLYRRKEQSEHIEYIATSRVANADDRQDE